MKTAAAYIRVSTSDQMEYSPDSQLKCIREYAEKNGFSLPEEYIFREDDGVSGRGAAKRAEFRRMIAAAKRRPRPFDCILLWKFSRFARSRTDSVLYKSLLRRQGIEVVSVSEPLGDDKTSILIEAMIEAMDEYYSLNLAEEVRRGMSEKVSRGEPVTAPPFGYRTDGKRYVPDPVEAGAVRLIYSDFLSGLSCGEIAEKLNAAGFRTRRGGRWESRAVRYVLKNPAYFGALRWNPGGPLGRGPSDGGAILTEGCHEPLVSRETWDAARTLLGGGKPRRRGSQPCVLRGLVRCGSCGALLVPSGSGSLQCSGYSHGLCGVSHSVSAEKLEAMVTALLERDLRVVPAVARSSSPAEAEEAGLLRRRLDRERARLARLREAYLNGAEPLKQYEASRAEMERLCRKLEEELAAAGAAAPPGRTDLISALRGDGFTPQEKNALLRSVVEKIVFDREEDRIRLYYR